MVGGRSILSVSEEEGEGEGEREREREKSDGERREVREKIYKIMICTTTITVHICTVTVAIVHKCTILHPLMWIFFS